MVGKFQLSLRSFGSLDLPPPRRRWPDFFLPYNFMKVPSNYQEEIWTIFPNFWTKKIQPFYIYTGPVRKVVLVVRCTTAQER